MAAPAFGSAGTQLEGTASTMNVDVPDNVAIDDIVVVTAFVNFGTTVTVLATDFAQAPDSPVVVNPASAWNHLYVMWKRATAADATGGTYDFTLSASDWRNAQAIRYTGAVLTGDPWDITNSAEAGGADVSVSPAVSATTSVDDALLVWAASNWNGPAAPAWTPPAGFTERRDTGSAHVSVADKDQAVAGATGSITGTCTAANKSGAWLGALKPFVPDPGLNPPNLFLSRSLQNR